jgi:Ni,Fe-hydrogenase maturation factor
MPQDVIVFAVQTHNVEIISSDMTPAVRAAVPKVVKMIMAEIEGK